MQSLVLVAVLVASSSASNANPGDDPGAFRVLSRALDKCSAEPDMYSCLKLRAVNLLDRALSLDTLPVSEYLSVVKDPQASDAGVPPPLTRADLEATLPRDLGERGSALDKMIGDRINKYLETRTIQLNMPTDLFEARGQKYKGGKGGGIFLVFGAFAAMLLQLALGKIALLAGKALLVGKVALLLAGIIGLKSLLSHNHESHSAQVIYAEPEHHGGWGRSMKGEVNDPQDLVYRAHRPSAANHHHSRNQGYQPLNSSQ